MNVTEHWQKYVTWLVSCIASSKNASSYHYINYYLCLVRKDTAHVRFASLLCKTGFLSARSLYFWRIRILSTDVQYCGLMKVIYAAVGSRKRWHLKCVRIRIKTDFCFIVTVNQFLFESPLHTPIISQNKFCL
jgi:hypothetical protein